MKPFAKRLRTAFVTVTVLAGVSTMSANANVYNVTGLGLDAVITTDASDNVISMIGSVGTWPGDTQNPGAILGPVSPANIVFTGGGTNIFGLDGKFFGTSPYFTDSCCGGLGFTFVNATDGGNTIGAAVGLNGIAYFGTGTYELFIGLATDRHGDLTVSVAETPLPAALPLFATGLGTLGLLNWRRKRKTAAVAA